MVQALTPEIATIADSVLVIARAVGVNIARAHAMTKIMVTAPDMMNMMDAVMVADQGVDILTVTESDMAIAVIIITYIMMDNVASPETEITRNHQPV